MARPSSIAVMKAELAIRRVRHRLNYLEAKLARLQQSGTAATPAELEKAAYKVERQRCNVRRRELELDELQTEGE